MPNYFQGTIQTLSQMVQRKQAANLERETPQYQAALLSLIKAKHDAVLEDYIQRQLQILPAEQIPEFLARQGKTGLLQETMEQQGANYRLERGFETDKTLEDIKQKNALIRIKETGEEARKTKRIPTTSSKYIYARERIANTILSKWDQTKQTFSEFFNGLDPKEQDVLDKIFRSPNLFDLIGGFGTQGEQPELK